tara:strand:- start:939 stop:1232 length:294 start_codon:yes stop_codon:yes gene_type:complete
MAEEQTKEKGIKVTDFPMYTVYSDGRVWSDYQYRFLNQKTTYQQYAILRLKSKGKEERHFVHTLVARHFLPNPENSIDILHINGRKKDNRVDNLRWV